LQLLLPLHDAPTLASAILYDDPIAVRLAILLSCLAAQKHADNMPTTKALRKGEGRHYKVFSQSRLSLVYIYQSVKRAYLVKIEQNCCE